MSTAQTRVVFLVTAGQPSVRDLSFQVNEGLAWLVASGFADGEVARIEIADGQGQYVPILRNGVPLSLRPDNNQVVLPMLGTYRVTPAAEGFSAGVNVTLYQRASEGGIAYAQVYNAAAVTN